MADAARMRRKAELCFAIAELLSNPADAKSARSVAEQYAQRARDAEEVQATRRRSSSAMAEASQKLHKRRHSRDTRARGAR